MKILDLLLARNAPAAFRRPLIVLSVIVCVVWSFRFSSRYGTFVQFDPSTWLTYFIGLVVAAFALPTAVGVYFFLPPLGQHRRWEILLIIGGTLVFVGLFVFEGGASAAARAGMQVEKLLVVLLFFAFAPTAAIKVLVWVWQGVRH